MKPKRIRKKPEPKPEPPSEPPPPPPTQTKPPKSVKLTTCQNCGKELLEKHIQILSSVKVQIERTCFATATEATRNETRKYYC